MSNRNPDERQKQEQWKKPEDESAKDPKREQKPQQQPQHQPGGGQQQPGQKQQQPKQPGQQRTDEEKDPNKRRTA